MGGPFYFYVVYLVVKALITVLDICAGISCVNFSYFYKREFLLAVEIKFLLGSSATPEYLSLK